MRANLAATFASASMVGCALMACSPEPVDYSQGKYSQAFKCTKGPGAGVTIDPGLPFALAKDFQIGKPITRKIGVLSLPDGSRINISADDVNKDGNIDHIVILGDVEDPKVVATLVGRPMELYSSFSSQECQFDAIMVSARPSVSFADIERADYCERRIHCSIEKGDTCSRKSIPRSIVAHSVFQLGSWATSIVDYSSVTFKNKPINGPSCPLFK